MNPHKHKVKKRKRRQLHVRTKIFGCPEKPRLAVFRSSRHIYCQLVDDSTGRTIVSASTMDRDIRPDIKNGGSIEAASIIGTKLAERAQKAGVSELIFDRRSYKFHGRVKALAESARKTGLKF